MTVRKFLYIITVFLTISCCHNDITKGIFTSGLILIDVDHLSENDSIYLFSGNGEIINTLISGNDGWYFEKGISCRAYYPDYGIIFIDGFEQKDNKYKIYCNGTWCYISARNCIKYISWNDFIVEYAFISTTISNPVRISPQINAQLIDLDYDSVYFLAKKVEQEWIFVDVYFIEQTSPFKQGWIQWRNNNDLLIDIDYTL